MTEYKHNFSSGRILIFSLVLASLLISSCSTKKNIIRQPLREEGEAYLLGKLTESELKFDWLTARCNVAVIDDKKSKTEFNGQIRMKADSVLWISLSPALGIEVARLMITSDSIKFINRLDKNYFTGDFDFISNKFQTTVDFDILQAIILGNDMHSYENESFRAGIDRMEYKLQSTNRHKNRKFHKQKDNPKILVQNIWLNPDNFKITRINLKEFGEDNKRLQADYSSFKAIDSQLFPSTLIIEIQSEKKLTVEINFTRLELNSAQVFPFKIPDNYVKMK
ncbi:MAG: DUF4292 domain-containing protein [Bacteroidales bacterium]